MICPTRESSIAIRAPECLVVTERDRGHKAARRLGIPIFVIAKSPESSSLRRVRLGWVAEWDDRTEQFLVMFGEEPRQVDIVPDEDEPFSAIEGQSKRLTLTARRAGQARFHFGVFMRYGPSCAVCSLDVPQVLDTPHVVPVAARGTNDPRNGLVMCATHHRAFDSHLLGLNPDPCGFALPRGARTLGGSECGSLTWRVSERGHTRLLWSGGGITGRNTHTRASAWFSSHAFRAPRFPPLASGTPE